ncbi:unnamed protein product [Brassica rapa]|uniref:Uncharacterized protein n=1 Tax=Brassica campestris TaxID=3711 RepID=A0A8D9G691_BRACM|nr:unnamed protein product [Brassica rapa]
MESHRRPVCADGHTRTHTDVLCVLTDTHSRPLYVLCVLTGTHSRPVCADRHTRTNTDIHGCPVHGQPWMFCVCWQTPTDLLFVLNRQPTWVKITQTVHGKGQRAESKDQHADMKGQHAEFKDQRADMCTDAQPRTSCVC